MLARMWRKGTFVHCRWECKLVQPLQKTVWSFLKKLKLELPHDPAIPLLGLYLKTTKTIFEKIHAPQHSLQHYVQQPRHGSNLSAHEQPTGLRYAHTHTHTHTHWNITPP